jgi:hypothetical protein
MKILVVFITTLNARFTINSQKQKEYHSQDRAFIISINGFLSRKFKQMLSVIVNVFIS